MRTLVGQNDYDKVYRCAIIKLFEVMSHLKRLLLSVLMLATLIAVAIVNPLFAADMPLEFTPQNGFIGESEGNGTLRLLLGKPRAFHVSSHGKKQTDGTFRLDQTITFQGRAPQERFWIITTTNNNNYSAILSDAAGQVKGITSGSHLSLKYRVKGPLMMHQELELSADGKTIDNIGVIKLLGIPIGRLAEVITRKLPVTKSNH